MDHTFEVFLKGHGTTLYVGISGVVGSDELHLIENLLLEIEKALDKNTFIFDFSGMVEISIVAISAIVLMQMEARKRGRVHTMAPQNKVKTLLISFGAIRETELLSTQNFSSLQV